MIRDCKLESHKSAFCHVVIHEDGVNLVSYETSVCQVCIDREKNIGYVQCSGNYSMSTIKHIAWFTSEFCGRNMYQDIRVLLVEAQKHNAFVHNDKLRDDLIVAVRVPMGEHEIERCKKKIEWYYENGKRFNGYSKQPNYDFNMYGYRRMNPIILP